MSFDRKMRGWIRHPLRVKLTVVEGFCTAEIASWAHQHLGTGTRVVSGWPASMASPLRALCSRAHRGRQRKGRDRASRVSMGEHESRQRQERLAWHLPCGSTQVGTALSRGVRVPVQSPLRPARDHSEVGLHLAANPADAGAAAQVALSLSGNQDRFSNPERRNSPIQAPVNSRQFRLLEASERELTYAYATSPRYSVTYEFTPHNLTTYDTSPMGQSSISLRRSKTRLNRCAISIQIISSCTDDNQPWVECISTPSTNSKRRSTSWAFLYLLCNTIASKLGPIVRFSVNAPIIK